MRENLAAVLILLRKHQLYSKLSKCSFFQTKVHYLRHVSKEDNSGSREDKGYHGVGSS